MTTSTAAGTRLARTPGPTRRCAWPSASTPSSPARTVPPTSWPRPCSTTCSACPPACSAASASSCSPTPSRSGSSAPAVPCRSAAAWAVVGLNVLWATGSVVAVLTGTFATTTAGDVWLVLQAAVVAGFAALQVAGLRRLS